MSVTKIPKLLGSVTIFECIKCGKGHTCASVSDQGAGPYYICSSTVQAVPVSSYTPLDEPAPAPALPLLQETLAAAEDNVTVYRGPADEDDFVPPAFEMSEQAEQHWFGKPAAALPLQYKQERPALLHALGSKEFARYTYNYKSTVHWAESIGKWVFYSEVRSEIIGGAVSTATDGEVRQNGFSLERYGNPSEVREAANMCAHWIRTQTAPGPAAATPVATAEPVGLQKLLSQAHFHGWLCRERLQMLGPGPVQYPAGLDYEEQQEYAFQQWLSATPVATVGSEPAASGWLNVSEQLPEMPNGGQGPIFGLWLYSKEFGVEDGFYNSYTKMWVANVLAHVGVKRTTRHGITHYRPQETKPTPPTHAV